MRTLALIMGVLVPLTVEAATFTVSDSFQTPAQLRIDVPALGLAATTTAPLSLDVSGTGDTTLGRIENTVGFGWPVSTPLGTISNPFAITAVYTGPSPGILDPPLYREVELEGFTWLLELQLDAPAVTLDGTLYPTGLSPIAQIQLPGHWHTELFHQGASLGAADFDGGPLTFGADWRCTGPSSSVSCDLAVWAAGTLGAGFTADQRTALGALFGPLEPGETLQLLQLDDFTAQAWVSGAFDAPSVPEPAVLGLLVLAVFLGAVGRFCLPPVSRLPARRSVDEARIRADPESPSFTVG